MDIRRVDEQADVHPVSADLREVAQCRAAAPEGTRFTSFRCDVSSEEDGKAVVAAATAAGKLMGLINCAGIAPAVKTVGTNLTATFNKVAVGKTFGTVFKLFDLGAFTVEPSEHRVVFSQHAISGGRGMAGELQFHGRAIHPPQHGALAPHGFHRAAIGAGPSAAMFLLAQRFPAELQDVGGASISSRPFDRTR